jgi:hypothetical protein
MLCCVKGTFITSFSGRDTATYVPVGNWQKTSRMPERWSTSFTERTRRSHRVNPREQLSIGTWKRRKWVEFPDSGAEEWHQSDDLFYFSLLHVYSYWSGPVQMAWHGFYHHQITVKWRCSFPVRQIRSIIVRIVLSCFLSCIKICSPGGLRIERGIV